MFRLPTIFGKGILVISIPLFTQAIFVGTLIKSATEDAEAQRWAVHTKDVITRIEEAYRWLLESNAGVRDLLVLERPRSSESVERDLARATEAIAQLRELVADNLAQQDRVDDLAAQCREFRALLSSMERLASSGQRARAGARLDEAAAALSALRSKIDVILAEETRLDQLRRDRSTRANSWHFWVLTWGGAITVALTLGLALLFFKQIVTRLEVLRENTRRLAEGRGLALPLAGEDELAQVDRAFHEMASSLDMQKQENEMFVYSVSHDLRSPLINLQGFSHELKSSSRDLEAALFESAGMPISVVEKGRKLLKENVAESIYYIQAAVDRLSRIIDSLLLLSRAGRVHYKWQTVDVGSVVGRVVDALHDSIREKRAEVVVNTLPEACGDPTALEQIFGNLLSNAVKYLDPARPGRIEIGDGAGLPGEIPAGLNRYYVKDNGLGIPEAYHARVFAAFNRLHAAAAPGEGIGLALARRMVERHGGSIWLESAPGVGTTFFVTLPAQSPDRSTTEDHQAGATVGKR